MEANTLRLENYVEYNSMFFKVKMISKSGISCDRGKGIVELSIKDVNPIPLSEDILLKMGFVKSNSENLMFLAIPKINAEVHYETLNYGNVIIITSDFGTLIPDDIEFVHQLQNLVYAISGIELTIKE